ncbi:MAG: rRNA pseudouridine synthase [Clostridiales bacterium]|nr:rRNA pseudouridine synthase [Clostridiales bacterium]
MSELRIQKYLADAGVMSRRAAEREIALGSVLVNGVPAEIGQKIDPERDVVKYRGRVIKQGFKKYVYIMLNKPRGYVTTASDERGRPTVVELTREVGERIYPVGRLDMDSEGLLLLTNDGELTNKLTHPRHSIPKIYHVEVSGTVDEVTLRKLSSPLEIDGYKIRPVDVSVVSMPQSDSAARKKTTVLKMELFEGRNRQIRKMCEQCGLDVVRLTRIAIGNLKLGSLKPGDWRHLTRTQIEYLKKS